MGVFIVMKKKYKLLCLFIGGILLLASIGVHASTHAIKYNATTTSSIDSLSHNGDIIYVNASNTQGPWNGTVDHPYQNITSALEHAQTGDTIYVFSGIYYEHLIINKHINLQGENATTTIIDGKHKKQIIHVAASQVTIDSFTLQHCGYVFEDAAIYARSNEISITNNIFINNTQAILLWNSDFSEILTNAITYSENGISLINSNSNSIQQNIIQYCTLALSLDQSSNNDIHSNYIQSNQNGILITTNSHLNTIVSNTIANNQQTGIMIKQLLEKELYISFNNFIDNGNHAYFETSLWVIWNKNYWDNWFGILEPNFDFLPKFIIGRLIGTLPWVNIDLNPASAPFSI
jgi:parallel beta-helix repeat protein